MDELTTYECCTMSIKIKFPLCTSREENREEPHLLTSVNLNYVKRRVIASYLMGTHLPITVGDFKDLIPGSTTKTDFSSTYLGSLNSYCNRMKAICCLAAIVCIVPILRVALVETGTPCQPGPLMSFKPERVTGTWYATNLYWPFDTTEYWRDYTNTFTLHPNGNMTWRFDLRWMFTNFSECDGWFRELVPDPDFNGKYDWIHTCPA
ncbi:uncharacterized protein LOC106160116 isoform X2 [Lingula anatina]|uniref:Uncharacterized protein LOC106160116 isoform X2 n=1 Tax=Lingula anatina TaxID=7574 RepID=A0A1S3I405_LINAN|nr:uncharacterized protein LOC106160116 isoform X2 [Lingula anatina]|eukprot:XP_013392089.1 uncharacterized protein LOC106160116 isoform X2 [Lingula anatina]